MSDWNETDTCRRNVDRRDMDAVLAELVQGQSRLANMLTEQHKEQTLKIEKVIDEHVVSLHKDYTPDHHEQHGRLSAWFRRIDGIWDNVFKAVGLFFLLALGYGLLVVVNIKGAGI